MMVYESEGRNAKLHSQRLDGCSCKRLRKSIRFGWLHQTSENLPLQDSESKILRPWHWKVVKKEVVKNAGWQTTLCWKTAGLQSTMNLSVSAPTDSYFWLLSQLVLEVLVTLKVLRRSVHNTC
jgi:hypothetical protein